MTTSFSLSDFLRAFAARRSEQLEPFLHEDAAYEAEGFAPIAGRRAVLAYWRRMFQAHDVVRMSLSRQVRDGALVVAEQRQLYISARRPPLVLDGVSVFEFEDGFIRLWRDGVRAADLPQEATELRRRLRTARW